MNDDGTMARTPELMEFAKEHDFENYNYCRFSFI